MPFLIRGPGIPPGSISKAIVSNVDFAATWLEMAGLRIPSYMQGSSCLSSLIGSKEESNKVAYHRYWMHADGMHNAYVSRRRVGRGTMGLTS